MSVQLKGKRVCNLPVKENLAQYEQFHRSSDSPSPPCFQMQMMHISIFLNGLMLHTPATPLKYLVKVAAVNLDWNVGALQQQSRTAQYSSSQLCMVPWSIYKSALTFYKCASEVPPGHCSRALKRKGKKAKQHLKPGQRYRCQRRLLADRMREARARFEDKW